ncbi:sialate O-acetylesterase [Arcicella rosea]|uniref:Lysophospholipase L1-like esterase n=1 Tax=Arcicella rosea TaxID=502909 RepID=A0A841ENE5_9BACT|nr:sialate O-acetylesterase [Arcicella rosea]MBB6002543.1 lysophospholipase L1-like esterase [Arcicella rosea]
MKKVDISKIVILFFIVFALGFISSPNVYSFNKLSAGDTLDIKQFNNEDFTVIFTFGQSNSANYGQGMYTCKQDVYNWYKGKMFKAKDPLLGADNNRGSVWTRLADKLIQENFAKKILIVPIGIGSTEVAQWAKGGKHNELVLQTIKALNTQGIIVDYILWHQGESDNLRNTSKELYIQRFESVRETFRNNNQNAPIFIAIASYHPSENSLTKKKLGIDPTIQEAQLALTKIHKDIFLGANTDKLDKSYYRHDGIHFSVLGLEKHAELWLKSLKKYIPKVNSKCFISFQAF